MKMQEVTQLKTIRDEALARLKNNPDYKLMTSLDSLIIELEGVSALVNLAENNVVVTDKPQTLGSSKKLEKDTRQLQKDFNLIGFNAYGEHLNGVHLNQTFTGVFISKELHND